MEEILPCLRVSEGTSQAEMTVGESAVGAAVPNHRKEQRQVHPVCGVRAGHPPRRHGMVLLQSYPWQGRHQLGLLPQHLLLHCRREYKSSSLQK
ncbi:uncharacterized protein [Panulirus ornatus]|uniref:uncharacterized protein isoform X2 n=1 Tax=Panulirus ornatus TaxID=150431 RepID=UPI003A844BC9